MKIPRSIVVLLLICSALISAPRTVGAYTANMPCAGRDALTKLRCADYFATRFSPIVGLCILGIPDISCPSGFVPASDLAIDADTRLIVIQFLSKLKQANAGGRTDTALVAEAFQELTVHVFGGTQFVPGTGPDGSTTTTTTPSTTLKGSTSTTTTTTTTEAPTTTLPFQGVDAPSDLTATAISQYQVRLLWTNNDHHILNPGIFIYRNGAQVGLVPGGRPGEVTTFLDQGLTANTTYTYLVRACTPTACSGLSNTATVTTQALTAAPSALTATAIDQNQIQLGWTNSAANTLVKIYRSQGMNNGSVLIVTVPSGTTSFRDQGLTPNTTYIYVAQACTSSGVCSAFSDPATATTQSDTAAPSGLTAVPVSRYQIQLHWTNNASNMAVKLYHDLGINGRVLVGTVPSGTTSFLDQGLTPNTSYSYVAQGCTSAGVCSADSNSTSAHTLP